MLWCKQTLHFSVLCKQDPGAYVFVWERERESQRVFLKLLDSMAVKKSAHLQVQLDGIHGGASTLCVHMVCVHRSGWV